MDNFTVCDQAGKTRYDGVSLRDSYDIWQQIAVVHAAYMTDENDMPITDMDCGGGVTLDWTDDHDTIRLFDSSCERESCWDCSDDLDLPTATDWDKVSENDGVQTLGQPQPLDMEDEWVVFGHVRNTRLGYFSDYRDAYTMYISEHDACRATLVHEQGLCHVRIAHRSDPKFLVQTGE